jgi:hypothetical protein
VQAFLKTPCFIDKWNSRALFKIAKLHVASGLYNSVHVRTKIYSSYLRNKINLAGVLPFGMGGGRARCILVPYDAMLTRRLVALHNGLSVGGDTALFVRIEDTDIGRFIVRLYLNVT